jgi:hypothetical protein
MVQITHKYTQKRGMDCEIVCAQMWMFLCAYCVTIDGFTQFAIVWKMMNN